VAHKLFCLLQRPGPLVGLMAAAVEEGPPTKGRKGEGDDEAGSAASESSPLLDVATKVRRA
jgi:hypothetical protein